MRALLTTLLAVLVALDLEACTPTHEGRLLVTVSTDLAVPSELARVEVETPFATQSFDPPLPFSFVVARGADRDPSAEVSITARGFAADGALVVTRTVRTSFSPNRTLILPIVLPRLCSSVGCAMPPPCPGDSVCSENGCVAERVEPAELAEARTAGQEIERSVDAGTGGVDPIPLESFCAEYADLQCDAVVACCPGLDWDAATRATFEADCTRALTDDCDTRFRPVLGDPRVGYDPVRAGRLLREGRRLTSPLTCSLAYVDWLADPSEGLQSIMRGTVLVGGDCTPMSATDISALYACQASVCQFAGEGRFTCAPRACNGEPCVGELACADGLSCTSNTILLPGRCEVRRPVGELCGDDSQCASLLCDVRDTRRCLARTAQAVFCPPPDEM